MFKSIPRTAEDSLFSLEHCFQQNVWWGVAKVGEFYNLWRRAGQDEGRTRAAHISSG